MNHTEAQARAIRLTKDDKEAEDKGKMDKEGRCKKCGSKKMDGDCPKC